MRVKIHSILISHLFTLWVLLQIVDPWGAVVCQTSEGVGVAVARLDLEYLRTIRREMPVMSHRRYDLYQRSYTPHYYHPELVHMKVGSSRYVSHKFGSVQVPGSCVFLSSQCSIAFVNKRPFTPGHVLVCPVREAARLTDLTPPEVSDLAQLTQAVVNLITTHYQTPLVSIAIQDGPAAGQTIRHLHLHVLPFNIQQHTLQEEGKGEAGLQGDDKDGERHWREEGEMEEEAEELMKVVKENLDKLSPQEPSLPQLLDVMECSDDEMTVNVGDRTLNVPSEAVFTRTQHCCAFVAPDPVLQGHIYICTLQERSGADDDVIGGYGSVKAEQAVDLLLATQMVQKHIERLFQVQAATITIFSHHNKHEVQVQIVPRQPNDLSNNDDIYHKLWRHQSQSSPWFFKHHVCTLAQQLREAIYTGTK